MLACICVLCVCLRIVRCRSKAALQASKQACQGIQKKQEATHDHDRRTCGFGESPPIFHCLLARAFQEPSLGQIYTLACFHLHLDTFISSFALHVASPTVVIPALSTSPLLLLLLSTLSWQAPPTLPPPAHGSLPSQVRSESLGPGLP